MIGAEIIAFYVPVQTGFFLDIPSASFFFVSIMKKR